MVDYPHQVCLKVLLCLTCLYGDVNLPSGDRAPLNNGLLNKIKNAGQRIKRVEPGKLIGGLLGLATMNWPELLVLFNFVSTCQQLSTLGYKLDWQKTGKERGIDTS